MKQNREREIQWHKTWFSERTNKIHESLVRLIIQDWERETITEELTEMGKDDKEII